MQCCSKKSTAGLDERHTLTTLCNSIEFTLNMATTALAEQVHRSRAHYSRKMSEFEKRIACVRSNQPIECEPLCEA